MGMTSKQHRDASDTTTPNASDTTTPSHQKKSTLSNHDQKSKHHQKPKNYPTPWKESKAKEDFAKELQDRNSAIWNMTIEEIHQSSPKYKCYKYGNFYRNVVRLEKKYNVTLPRREKLGKKSNITNTSRVAKNDMLKHSANDNMGKKKEGWRESKAKKILFKLLIDKKSYIHKKTDKEIYDSHPCFQEFNSGYFKRNLQTLRRFSADAEKIVADQERSFQMEQRAYPRKSTTVKGCPFWDDHPASYLLKKDVTSGLACSLKPADLRAHRKEYQDFPLTEFRKHIYQEQRDQREAGYWITKRNKDGQKKRDEEAQKLKEEWEEDHFDKEINEICGQWEQWNLASD
ncbi:hypothetical protein ACHAXR_011646 [Thalassiosira sp. AJA248-18]